MSIFKEWMPLQRPIGSLIDLTTVIMAIGAAGIAVIVIISTTDAASFLYHKSDIMRYIIPFIILFYGIFAIVAFVITLKYHRIGSLIAQYRNVEKIWRVITNESTSNVKLI